MGRKRDVPFTREKLEIWAAAVVHAIGSMNFLFDRSFEPFISSKEMNEYFGNKGTTVSNKARAIKDMFDLWYYSPEFSTGAMQENSPVNNMVMVMVDGLILPLNNLPQNMQQMVLRARAEGKDIEFTTEYEDQ
jgi:hypothetical protein